MNAGPRSTGPSSRGLTLVEVLVVLFILAVLAQTAVLATEGLAEQAQRDGTAQSIEGIEAAILGERSRVDTQGRSLITGFVADVGRLPVARLAGGPETSLLELWQRRDEASLPVADQIAAFSVSSPPGDAEIELACGWRGPYLRLGFGPARLVDGWNRPFRLWRADGSTVLDGETVTAMASFGSDGLLDGTPPPLGYERDIGVVIERTAAPLVDARHTGALVVNVSVGTATKILVRVYGPNGKPTAACGLPRTIGQEERTVSAGTVAAVTFSNLTIGPRVVRVYDATALATTPLEDDPIADIHPRSRIWRVTVAQGVTELSVSLP